MTKPITREDLFLAILSMDSYHRGYGAQVVANGRSETQIGNAILGSDSTDLLGVGVDMATGFYAISYDVSQNSGMSGPRVIAFRGTDYDSTEGYSSLRDIWTGWGVGGGATGNGWSLGSQAGQTLQFYELLIRQLSGNPTASIFDVAGPKPIVTGHSLGGGLAGLAAYLSGSKAVGFDHMPFGVAALASLAYQVTKAVEIWNADAAHADD